MARPTRTSIEASTFTKTEASCWCRCLDTPPARFGMFVNLRSGKRFLFIGDLTWALEGIELPAERPWVSRKLVDRDEAQVRASIVKVYQLSKRYPDLVVVPAHDRRVHNRIANFPDFEY